MPERSSRTCGLEKKKNNQRRGRTRREEDADVRGNKSHMLGASTSRDGTVEIIKTNASTIAETVD